MEHHAFQTVSLAVVLGVGSYALARQLRIPAILFYLVAGLTFGPMGLGMLRPDELGNGLPILVEVAVAIILFEGGLTLTLRGFRRAPTAIVRMLLLSVPVTALGGVAVARYVLGLSWELSAVFGTIAVVTGPTVIGPLLRTVNLTQRLEVLLHWESIWGDVGGVLLSALALEFAFVAKNPAIGGMALIFLLTVLDGFVVGILGGIVLDKLLLPWADRLREGQLPGIFALAGALGIFYGADAAMSSAGPLAVVVAGFYVSWRKSKNLHNIRLFKDQLSILFIGTLFVLLSAYVDPLAVPGALPAIVGAALLMMFVVRPLAVFTCLAGREPSLKEKLYMSLMGPRGIVALAAASYASLAVGGEGPTMSVFLGAMFMLILLSGVFATATAKPLAGLLKVTTPTCCTGIILVGLNPFSLELAKRIKERIPVVFLETNPYTCLDLRAEGLEGICVDILDDEAYGRAREEGFHRLVACTTDNALNELICHNAFMHLGEDNVFTAHGRRRAAIMAAETIFEVDTAFSEDFFVSEAISALGRGTAAFEVVQWPPRGEEAVHPLFSFVNGGGMEIVRPGREPEGEVLCLRSRSGGRNGNASG